MAKFGKWLGAGLGWSFGGPIGALLGFFIGSMFDNTEKIDISQAPNARSQTTQRGDFMVSLTILATAVMKADGTITRNELNYVKEFLVRNFGEEATREALSIIKRLNETDIPLQEVCQQIRFNMDHAAISQLLYFLFGIAKADGKVCTNEVNIVEQIARLLGVDAATFNSIKSMFYDDLDSMYTILGVDSQVSDADLKKAYRRIAMENHPDKVAHLGEEIRKAAEEKFTSINVAYEKIKKQRGIA